MSYYVSTHLHLVFMYSGFINAAGYRHSRMNFKMHPISKGLETRLHLHIHLIYEQARV